MKKRAKLFKNGASQAVRLPAEFRFEGEEIFIEREPLTGNVILSAYALNNWNSFFELRRSLELTDGFMESRPANVPLEPREIF